MTLGRTIGWWLLGASLLVACSEDDAPEPVGIMWGSGASGAFVEDTVPLLAFFRDRDGNSLGDPLTGVSWTSSNPDVLAIDGDTIAIALDTGAVVLRVSLTAPAYAVDVPFRVILRWQGRLVWSRSPDDGGQPRLAVQDYPSHTWRQLPDFGYPLSGTSDAYLSVDGRYVAATSTRRTSLLAPSTVFVMDLAADTTWAPLDDLSGSQFSATWFPGDTLLAFLGAASNGWEIFTARPDGSNVLQRTALGQAYPPFYDLTPEATIVLPLRVGAAPSDLFEVTLNGDTLTRLTTTPDHDETFPSVSPDGNRIAFVSTVVERLRHPLDASRVWLMNRDGSGAQPLLPALKEITGRPAATATSYSPSWSPDSRFVLITWSVDPYRRSNGLYYAFPDVYAVRVEDRLAIRLTRNMQVDAQPFFR